MGRGVHGEVCTPDVNDCHWVILRVTSQSIVERTALMTGTESALPVYPCRRRDLGETEPEHYPQHEDRPLERAEPLE
jgi:hypothetical protein